MHVRRPDLTRWILAFGAALLVISLVAPAGSAQEAGEPTPPDTDDDSVFRQVGRLDLGDVLTGDLNARTSNTSDLWMWPEGGLGYIADGTVTQADGLVSFDLDTLAVRDRRRLPLVNRRLTQGLHNAMAIDRDAGILYVAHHNTSGDFDNQASSNTDPGWDHTCSPQRVFDAAALDCFAGVYVLDARTLEPTGLENIDFAQVGTDAVGVELGLGSLSFTPKYGGKLHVLLAENAHSVPDPALVRQQTYARTAQQYAAQIDVDSGTVDWVVSLAGCTGIPYAASNSAEGVYGVAPIFASPGPERPYVWVGCWSSGEAQAGIVRLDLDESDPETPVVETQRRFLGPGAAVRFAAEPDAERILVKTSVNTEALWWAFDGRVGGFVSRAGIGPFSSTHTVDAIDPATGRLYTFAPRSDGDTAQDRHPGGLGFTDTRRSELAQFRWDTRLADLYPTSGSNDSRIGIDPGGPDRPRRVFVRPREAEGTRPLADHYLVFEDTAPITTDPPQDDVERSRSVDVPERPGATTARFQGSARGYGFKAILINGFKGVAGGNTGPYEAFENFYTTTSPCQTRDNTLAYGLAGSPHASQLASIDHLGSGSATARATYVDDGLQKDLDDPVTRCGRVFGFEQDQATWESLTDAADVRGLPEEPGVEPVPGSEPASCSVPDEPTGDASGPTLPTQDVVGDPVLSTFSAEVSCAEGAITGDASARTAGVGPVTVAAAGSNYRVEHRDGGGIVASVHSWTRGVTITGDAGTVIIDGIRTTATAWANGRAQPEDVDDDPNCDTDRTAGSCLRRHFSGVTVVDGTGETVFSCEQCSDEDNQRQLVDGIQRALGTSWIVHLPPADARRAGASDGAGVAVVKRADLQFADATLKNDLLPTLPGLEIVRINDTATEMGRQVFQFAGVEADLTYGINCLLRVVDGECQGEPTSLEISLTDVDGDPLDGGLFRVQPDPDGDGQIGLDETLLDAYACTTGPDGTCIITGMRPGTYVVTQATAPPGYVPAPDKAIDLPEGGQGRLDIVNGTPSVTGIAISLHDTSSPPGPIEGAEFEVHTGTAPVDAPLATCTTNANGTCEFEVAAVGGIDPITGLTGQDLTHVLQVPPGPYVLHQSSAPDGYQPVDDVAFDLPDGQIARVDLTNGVAAAGDGIGAAPSPSPGGTSDGVSAAQTPVAFQQPSEVPAPQFTINVNVQQEAPAPAPQVAGDEGDTINVFANPVGSAKLLLRDPKEAAAFAAAWLLFGSAAAAAWRRRMILAQFDV